MTRYTVVWHDAALAKLANLWTESLDRRGLAAAANQIDNLLRYDPDHQGVAESDRVRRLIVHPLAVLFRVSVDDRIAEVLDVKLDASTM